MIDSIKDCSVYKSLGLETNYSHAYLFYSNDSNLNNEIAFTFAKSICCENHNACNLCASCRQVNSGSYPDFIKLDQKAIKVDDINQVISKLNTKPFNRYKVFLIFNADTINEISQNKLLKSLEEPNPSNIFILTTSKTDKILPTIMSRLNKVFIPKLSIDDKQLISTELKSKNIDISKYLATDFSLTEMLNMSSSNEYNETLQIINIIFKNLNTTADIPTIVSSVNVVNKPLFFQLLQDIFIQSISSNQTKNSKYDKLIIDTISSKFNEQAIIKCLPLIAEAYKKLMSNVNFTYILDNLLFNLLKERFLCK